MFDLFRLLFLSENRGIYRSIAQEHKTSSLRVYRLAHGRKAVSNKDYKVLKSLRQHDIIEGVFLFTS